jgi:hypothetical protein
MPLVSPQRIYLKMYQRMWKNANLYPSEIVTIGILFTLKGVHCSTFYRWLKGDWLHLFPQLPDGSRLLRLLAAYEYLTDQF